jgi:hypothetical protein
MHVVNVNDSAFFFIGSDPAITFFPNLNYMFFKTHVKDRENGDHWTRIEWRSLNLYKTEITELV